MAPPVETWRQIFEFLNREDLDILELVSTTIHGIVTHFAAELPARMDCSLAFSNGQLKLIDTATRSFLAQSSVAQETLWPAALVSASALHRHHNIVQLRISGNVLRKPWDLLCRLLPNIRFVQRLWSKHFLPSFLFINFAFQ